MMCPFVVNGPMSGSRTLEKSERDGRCPGCVYIIYVYVYIYTYIYIQGCGVIRRCGWYEGMGMERGERDFRGAVVAWDGAGAGRVKQDRRGGVIRRCG